LLSHRILLTTTIRPHLPATRRSHDQPCLLVANPSLAPCQWNTPTTPTRGDLPHPHDPTPMPLTTTESQSHALESIKSHITSLPGSPPR
jgi:hypothetical protein